MGGRCKAQLAIDSPVIATLDCPLFAARKEGFVFSPSLRSREGRQRSVAG